MSKTVDFGDELKEKMLNTAEDSLKPIMNNLVSNDIPEGTGRLLFMIKDLLLSNLSCQQILSLFYLICFIKI